MKKKVIVIVLSLDSAARQSAHLASPLQCVHAFQDRPCVKFPPRVIISILAFFRGGRERRREVTGTNIWFSREQRAKIHLIHC